MTNIAIFYHVGQMGNWQEVYLEQIDRLSASGVLNNCKHFHIGINGSEPLPFIPENAHIQYNSDHILEANTLENLWHFARNNRDYKVLYLHTKGVTRVGTSLETVTREWRHYLEYFCIDKWQQCVQALDEHDTCGVSLRFSATYNNEFTIPATYYDGNFWWSNASYITTLDPAYMYVNDIPWLRGKSELWIGTGNPKAASIHNIDYINPYDDYNYSKEKYMTTERKAKIVMIAMFKNEAPILRRMLDSTLGYCDYYVMQNNGSTDGSEDIARQFLNDNNLQGEIYLCEEGWQGFGWNRDHLIRYCQEKVDHGCDWILKMDCDEILEVDADFDWSLIEDYSVPGYHITAVAGTTLYYRCWMWNARMPWGFNHDPCHETIYHQDPSIGEGFRRVDLPQGIRQIGLNEGQSWSNPTKFVTDALTLEEKMIAEGDMLEDHRQYHFWYIGKSYFDAHICLTFPLGENHKREYARRAIWYFAEWIKHVYRNKPISFNESAYNALIFSAEARRTLNEWEEALVTYQQAEVFARIRNDHLIGQIQCLEYLKRYDEMLAVAHILNDPSRTNPFPHSASFINNEHYVDTGTLPARMLEQAQNYVNAERVKPVLPFYINNRQLQQRRVFIVDNFYANPDDIRNYALTQVEYEEDNRWYKGMRSKTTYRPKGLKESFEHIIGQKIVDFESGYNGVFQIMRSSDPQVYHYDTQRWAGMIYLSPNAPIISGTRLHRSKINGTRHRDEPDCDVAFQGDFYDSTKFDITDSAANIYNRLLIMDAGSFHSAGPYFGNTMESGRLSHLFFFD